MTYQPDPPQYVVGTQEFVHAQVTSDVELGTQTVTMELNGGESLSCAWVGDPGLIRTCRTTSPVDFTDWTTGLKSQYITFTDSPEVPRLKTQGIRVIR